MQDMKLQDLKVKSPTELLAVAEEFAVENASALRKQELMFAILKQLAARDIEITGIGVVEILQDGFGFLRSPNSNYLPGPDDIYVSPSRIRRFGLRTGDTVEGQIRGPKEGERYFALLKVNKINFDDPEKIRHKVHFDNLTPLYPNKWLRMETERPESKDMSPRVIDIGTATGQALLRRGAQHRGRRIAHHHRDRADRNRQPHGRGDFRRVQGHFGIRKFPACRLAQNRR